jgi:hypothetical protein
MNTERCLLHRETLKASLPYSYRSKSDSDKILRGKSLPKSLSKFIVGPEHQITWKLVRQTYGIRNFRQRVQRVYGLTRSSADSDFQ